MLRLRRAENERLRARELAEEELRLARRFGAPRAVGVALRTLALTHSDIERERLLAESAATLAACGAQVAHAGALTDLGATLRRAGRRPAAREQLRLALDRATACGATALADALTPSERRVARLAADGLTNREIAQALFVTDRTVETHLTHVFQKLDINSRRQLSPALVEPAGAIKATSDVIA